MAYDTIDISAIQGTAGKMQPEIKKLMMETIRKTFGYLKKYPGDVQSSVDLLTFEEGSIMMPLDTSLSTTNKKLGIIDKRSLAVKVGMGYIMDEIERYRDTYLVTLDELGLKEAQLPFATWYLRTYADVGLKDLSVVPWQGIHNAAGTTPKDIADGYLKIIADDITATKISVAKGNLYELSGSATDYTASTIGDELKAQFAKFPQLTQEEGVTIHIPYRYKQMYKEWYKSEYTMITDGNVPTEFLDGSDNKAKFNWTSDIGTSKRVVMCTADNLVYGVDKASKEFGKVMVFNPNGNPYLMAATNKTVIGFQIHTINSRAFNCNNLA